MQKKELRKTKEEEVYVLETLPRHNKPKDMPVKSALHGKMRSLFYDNFYVCIAGSGHYSESCICEFTDNQIEPVIEFFTDQVKEASLASVHVLTAYSEENERMAEIIVLPSNDMKKIDDVYEQLCKTYKTRNVTLASRRVGHIPKIIAEKL